MLVSLDLLLGVGYWLLGLVAVNSQMGPRGVVQVAAVLAAVSVAACRRWALLGYGAALAGLCRLRIPIRTVSWAFSGSGCPVVLVD